MPNEDNAAAILARMQETMRQMQGIRDDMKAKFKYEFHNRPIEDYAGALFDHFAKDVADPADEVLVNGIRKQILKWIEDTIELANYCKYIHTGNRIQPMFLLVEQLLRAS